jgi:hypothetical protein
MTATAQVVGTVLLGGFCIGPGLLSHAVKARSVPKLCNDS